MSSRAELLARAAALETAVGRDVLAAWAACNPPPANPGLEAFSQVFRDAAPTLHELQPQLDASGLAAVVKIIWRVAEAAERRATGGAQ